jgi:hypothetical protein
MDTSVIATIGFTSIATLGVVVLWFMASRSK